LTELTGNTFFEGPVGRIEAILKSPAQPVARTAVVCHPHPLHGGTMHNKVVYRLANAFYHVGFATLRFNFRGTGLSAGQHDFGNGEQEDLMAAMAHIEQIYPGAEMWLAGFSFGSAVALRVACRHAGPHGLVAVGLPVSIYEFKEAAGCTLPKLFVQGEFDQFGSPDRLKSFFDGLAEPKKMVVIEGADHFFEGKLDQMGKAVSDFIEEYRAVGNEG
jgi:uncharacterized protein